MRAEGEAQPARKKAPPAHYSPSEGQEAAGKRKSDAAPCRHLSGQCAERMHT